MAGLVAGWLAPENAREDVVPAVTARAPHFRSGRRPRRAEDFRCSADAVRLHACVVTSISVTGL